MKVKFVRHGETDLNKPIRRMQGISNYDLNENGIKKSDIKTKYSDKKVLVVAHNGVISVISCIVEGEPEDGNFECRGIRNGELKEFDF